MKYWVILLVVAMFVGNPFAEAVLYDHDFRTGDAGAATVRGGTFDNGWRQVEGESPRGRIVFTVPEGIRRGYAEVTFTLDRFGTQYFSSDKNIYFSVYKSDGMAQRSSDGHYAYVRIRRETSRNYFVEFKAYDRPANSSEGETRVCCRDDWMKYIGKEAVMRFTWSDQENVKLTYPDQDGSGSKTATRPYKITGVRHVVIGAENSYNAAVYCFRYLSLKVVDFDKSASTVVLSPLGARPATNVTAGSRELTVYGVDGRAVSSAGRAPAVSIRVVDDAREALPVPNTDR